MAKLVENVYGDALFDLAIEQNLVDQYLEETKILQQILEEHPEVIQVMTHPQIIKEERIQLMETIFHGKCSDEIVGLMKLVLEKGHFSDMTAILEYFKDRVMEYHNIGRAIVTTPLELSDDQKKQVEQRLLETTDYVSLEITYQIDASLIGGMVIRIGDRIVDSSIKTKLYDLSKELSKIQLKVGECAS